MSDPAKTCSCADAPAPASEAAPAEPLAPALASCAAAAAPEGEPLERRQVLSAAVSLAGGAIAYLCGASAGAAPYDWEAHRWAYLIDVSKCIGCGNCVRACKAENDVPDGFVRTWVERYLVNPEGGAYVESPAGGLDGFAPAQVDFTPSKAFFVPKMCNHCTETPCIQVCPVGASYSTKDGVVLVDDRRCIGCGYCVQACPYGSRFLNPNTGTAEKCTWCYHRITKGEQPACVEACPTGTRMFGDLRRVGDPVRERIHKEAVAVLQPHLLTEPNCYYLHLDKEVR